MPDFLIDTRAYVSAVGWGGWYELWVSGDWWCEICDPWVGGIYFYDEEPYPPLHPNCDCERIFWFDAPWGW